MKPLKKFISLKEAAQISGYNQDYLGSLIRKGEIQGKKIGRSWLTTEEEIQGYLFKQKIRRNDFVVGGFFSPRRTRNILILAVVVFIGIFSVGSYFANDTNTNQPVSIQRTLSDNTAEVVTP